MYFHGKHNIERGIKPREILDVKAVLCLLARIIILLYNLFKTNLEECMGNKESFSHEIEFFIVFNFDFL